MASHLDEGLLEELLDGEIPSSELPPIQAHLAACAECRARLEEARAIGGEADQLIETIELPEAPARGIPVIPRVRPRAWIRNLAWAATIVVAAGVGYLARNPAPAMLAKDTALGEPAATRALPVAPAETVAALEQAPAPATPLRKPARPEGAVLGHAAGRERAADGGAASPASPLPPPAERDEAKAAAQGSLRNLAASADSDSTRKKQARRLGDSPLKLEEIVTTGARDSRVAAGAPAPTLGKGTERRALQAESTRSNVNRLDELVAPAAKAAEPAVEITLREAQEQLQGSLRLIEGLVPLRLERSGPDVRVVYRLGSSELLLLERLDNGRVTYRLTAPPGFPADSLDRLRARVHD